MRVATHRHPRRGPSRAARVLTALLAGLALACGEAPDPASAPQAPAPSPTGVREGVGADEIARLRALGYVDVVDQPADDTAQRGVVERGSEREPGEPLYYTNAATCSSVLMRGDGRIERRWQSPGACGVWGNSVLLETGEVLALHGEREPGRPGGPADARRALLKLGWDGELIWRADLPVHHDVEVLADGRIAALTQRTREIPAIDPARPTIDHFITLMDAAGRPLEEASITGMLLAAGDRFAFDRTFHARTPLAQRDARGDEIDLIHSNSIAWMRDPALAARDPRFALDHVIVCMRHQNAVAIFDWSERRLVWSWGQGELMGPHDASVLPNGHVLIFDNGLGRGWSRVLEVDPDSGAIVWEYHATPREDFYTLGRGAVQPLANGNRLVTSSAQGRVFEVTRAGEVVWEFRNPETDPHGRISVIARARRVPPASAPGLRFGRSD